MPRAGLVLFAVGSIYFVAGKLGLALAFLHPSATPIWPPTGIAVAAMLLYGLRCWPAITAGAFLVNWTTAGSLPTSLAIAAGNTLEAVAGAALALAFANGAASFERGRDVFRFALLTGLVATTISPAIGVTALTVAGFADPADYPWIWLTWWLGDLGGVLVVAPPVLLWVREGVPRWSGGRWIEAAALLACAGIASLIAFGRPVGLVAGARYPLSYLCFLPLLWAAFRFGPREAATILLVVAVLAISSTLSGFGSFVVGSPNESLMLLDAFLTVASLTSLGLAAVVYERREATDRLQDAERRLQELLRREREEREQAQASSRAKDQFLAVLSHELRSPLAALLYAGGALKLLAPGRPEIQSPQRIVERQTRYLTDLVDDLLEASRLDSGKVTLRREIVDLNEVTVRCVASFRLSGRLAARVVTTTHGTAWVEGDPTRLEQIVANLLENALHYTSPGGRIELGVAARDGEAVLRVADDGEGIDAHTLPKVFDFFAQADDSLDRSHGGLGIGLSIVRRLAELHGGSVEARSEGKTRGSEFLVRLPLAPAPAASVAVPPAVEAAPRGLRILVVEDYADARLTLRELLEILGHEVESAEDGERGLDLALAWHPDLALIDIGLPKLDGFTVARKIRDDPAARSIRLVAITGYGQTAVQEQALQSGFDRCLVKPVDARELSALLAKCAEERPLAAEPARNAS